MFRFRPPVMISMLALLLIAGEIGSMAPAFIAAAKQLIGYAGLYVVLDLIGTAVLVGFAGGVRRSLPNYSGAPPIRAVARILVPLVVIGLLAAANSFVISGLLAHVLENQPGRIVALHAARATCLGTVVWCLYHAAFIITEFRRDCAWPRRMEDQ